MFSLQLSITNFTSFLNQNQLHIQESITLRYGPLQTEITVNNGCGGKKLIFEMSTHQLENLFTNYACGLFIKNEYGKFFCILNLQNLEIGRSVQNFLIGFFDDQRRNSYQAKLSLSLSEYNPRMPKRPDSMMRQNVNCNNFVNMMKQVSQKNYEKPTLNSFLYGNKTELKNRNYQNPNNILKQPTNFKIPINANNFNSVNNTHKQKSRSKSRNKGTNHSNVEYMVAKYQNQQNFYDDDDNNPPVMQFTNEGDEQMFNIKIIRDNSMASKANTIMSTEDARILQQMRNQKAIDTKISRKQFINYSEENSQPFHANIEQHSQSNHRNQTKNHQKKRNLQLQKQNNLKTIPKIPMPNVPKPLKAQNSQKERRETLRKLAIQRANEQAKGNVMIPIYTENGYELIPISSLSKEEIVSYVRKQKQFEENKRQNSGDTQKNKNMRQKTPDKYLHFDKQKDHGTRVDSNTDGAYKHVIRLQDNRPHSAHVSDGTTRKISVHPSIKEQQQHYQSENYDEDYQSDFQSMSIANSAIKSHSWKKQNYAIEQSINDQGYSQDFDSYSQSMLSKTHQKPHSVSEIGESIRSISQSFRAK